MNNLPLLLVILDGFGLSDNDYGNAIKTAKTPVFDKLWNEFAHTKLFASGLTVGLPDGQMGNSEVGHLNIGTGRVVKQSLVEIDDAIANGSLQINPFLQEAFSQAKENNSIHLLGLVSDGGVHSHINHLTALVQYAKEAGIENIYIHAITDGRDVAPKSAIDYIQQLDLELMNIGAGEIATLGGRFYAMDRDKRTERTKKYYDAICGGLANRFESAEDAINNAYKAGVTDEFIEPVVINDSGLIKSNDVVICFNFRPDRMIQIVESLENPTEKGGLEDLHLKIYSMTKYSDNLNAKVLFPKQILKKTLGEVLAANNISQMRIAETEKYPHVTYFFNGGIEQTFRNENRILIPSPKVATYDMQPEMSAHEVANAVIKTIKNKTSDVIIVNFANCDMVGHTGIFDAAVKAVETVDTELGRILDIFKGTLLVTADHGNAEVMLSENGEPYTAHTTNLVPLIINSKQIELAENGRLCDIAPTILDILNIQKPEEMDGQSLIK